MRFLNSGVLFLSAFFAPFLWPSQPVVSCFESIRFFTISNPVSGFNLGKLKDVDFSKWRIREQVEFDASDLTEGKRVNLYSDPTLPAFKFQNFTSGFFGERAVFQSILGDRYSFPVKRLKDGRVRIRTQAKRVPVKINGEQKSYIRSLETYLRKQEPLALDNEQEVSLLANRITEKQMEISATFLDADELDRKKIKDAMYSANSQMLSVLSEGRELSLEDISHWNYEIFKSSSDETVALPAGIIRGDSESKDVINPLSDTRERVRVDISGANAAGGTLKSGPEFWYTDAARVPFEMKALVREINKIGRETSLEEIVGVYRNFIIIHPFVDGNGRTGRVLFDYMLLKAGFPSLPSNPTLRNVFYRTESEFNNQLINSYIAE